jgi:hypothetical protein
VRSTSTPISSIAATKTGGGYWLAAIDGGVASATPSWLHRRRCRELVDRAVTPTGSGKGTGAGIDGSVYPYGDGHEPTNAGGRGRDEDR